MCGGIFGAPVTVRAEQRQPSRGPGRRSSGETIRAEAGDWAVCEVDCGDSWSVRDDIFRASYEHIDGDSWRRRGFVDARPARTGEVIEISRGLGHGRGR